MTGILATLCYSVAVAGAGLLALRALGLREEPGISPGLSLASSAFILGQALVSAVWLLLGLAGWLKPWVVWAVLAALVAGALPLARPWLGQFRGAAPAVRAWWQGEAAGIRVLAVAMAVLAAGFAVAAWMKPPFGDAEAFYMTYARVIAATGRIEPMPGLYETFSSIGMVGEPQFAALIAISGVPAAKLFVWLLAAASASMLVAIGRCAGLGTRDGILLLAMLLTTTAFTHHAWDGKVDLFAAALGLLAVHWTLASRTAARNGAALCVAGLGAGFAVVAKFSYAISLAPAIMVLLLWPRQRAPGERTAVTAVIIVGACAAAATVPHLLKNALMFSAPFAPFFGGAADQNWLQQVWFAPDVVQRIVATYPFALVFGRYPMQGGNLSFLWIAFLPLLWWLPGKGPLRDSLLFQLCVAGLAGTLCWIALRPSIIAPRYLLAVLLLFFPAVARAAGHILDTEIRPRILSSAIIAAGIAALAIFSYPLLPIAAEGARQFLRGGDAKCALASNHCEPLQRLNSQAAPGARVYALSYYLYWMRDDLLQCRDRGAESKAALLLGGEGLSWQWLLDRGFEWVVVDRASHAKDHAALLAAPRPDSMALEILHQDNDIVIMRLQRRGTAAGSACSRQGGSGWTPGVRP